MSIRKMLRSLFHTEHNIALNKVLLEEGIVFNWKPIFDAAGHLSSKQQRKLGKLIAEFIYDNTVTVYNESAFMKQAVMAFEHCKLLDFPEVQKEFERAMRIT